MVYIYISYSPLYYTKCMHVYFIIHSYVNIFTYNFLHLDVLASNLMASTTYPFWKASSSTECCLELVPVDLLEKQCKQHNMHQTNGMFHILLYVIHKNTSTGTISCPNDNLILCPQQCFASILYIESMDPFVTRQEYTLP